MAQNTVPRLGITVPRDMYEALEAESAKNFGTPVAALVRQAVREWLADRGYDLQEKVTRGGYRRGDSKDSDQSPGKDLGITLPTQS